MTETYMILELFAAMYMIKDRLAPSRFESQNPLKVFVKGKLQERRNSYDVRYQEKWSNPGNETAAFW